MKLEGSGSFARMVIVWKMLAESDLKYDLKVIDNLASSGMQISASQTFLKSLA